MAFGFIGLGDLGFAMAEMIGDPLTIFDIDRKVMDRFPERARRAASVADLARASDLIGVCVRHDGDVRDVVSGPNGLLTSAKPGTIVAIHATVHPETIVEQAALAARHGVHLFDAAVSGGAHIARARQQSCMVGGDAAVIDRARPLLDAFSGTILHAGALGQGMVLKFANNLTTYLELAAVVESFALATAAGIDPALLEQVMTSNGNLTRTMKLYVDYRAANAHELADGPFRDIQIALAGLAEKDLGLAIAAGEHAGVQLRAAAAIKGVFREVVL